MTSPAPIEQRIREAFQDGEMRLSYHKLANRVFPPDQFPQAWRYASHGGPPGCYMALSAALRRMNISIQSDRFRNRFIARPGHSEKGSLQ